MYCDYITLYLVEYNYRFGKWSPSVDFGTIDDLCINNDDFLEFVKLFDEQFERGIYTNTSLLPISEENKETLQKEYGVVLDEMPDLTFHVDGQNNGLYYCTVERLIAWFKLKLQEEHIKRDNVQRMMYKRYRNFLKL